MPSHRLKRKLATFWQSFRVVLLVLVAVAALGSLYYFLATLGPKKIEYEGGSSVSTPDDPAMARLSNEIEKLEEEYRRADEAGLVTEESLRALENAVEKQRSLIRTYPDASFDQTTRLQRLEAALDTTRARQVVVKIEQLDREGNEAIDNGRMEAAREMLTEALELQRDVNKSNANSRFKNYIRETSLAQSLAGLDAAPLYQQKEAALAAARTAASDERWGDALAGYVMARDMQAQINRDFPRTRFADLSAQDRLEGEIASLNAAGVATEIDTKERAGDAAVAEGQHAQAAKLYGEALTLQLEINSKFSRSRFVSSPRVENLEVKQQTALSRPLTEQLEVLEYQIADDLRRRRVVSAERRVPDAVTLVNRLSAEFPKSRFQTGQLKLKLAYLALKQGDLRQIQDAVYARVLPLPDAGGHLMLRTETPQSLYYLVMNTNPSRNPGRSFPVDSVNWNDAGEFCMRMGWILGAPVRLPTEREFRASLAGDGGAMRGMETSDGRSAAVDDRTANPLGFQDLLGNLAEWLTASESESAAAVIGGSFLDTEDALKAVPTERRSKSDRARHIGFRFVIELGEQ